MSSSPSDRMAEALVLEAPRNLVHRELTLPDEKGASGVIDTYRTARTDRGEASYSKELWTAMETERAAKEVRA